jgi:hypothetical protein
VAARRVRPRAADVSRRSLLRAGTLAAGACAIYLETEVALPAAGLRGADRRFTGSHEQGTDRPAAMPVTQWLFDAVPAIDAARWRLAVTAGGSTRSWSYAEVAAADERRRATLDCTGGGTPPRAGRG